MAAAAKLGDQAPDHHRFVDKSVLLTGEEIVLQTSNGRECLLSALRLLARICPNLSVALPPGADRILEECRTLTDEIVFGGTVELTTGSPDFAGFDAILSVGTTARLDLPLTVINSDGWLARVSSGSTNLPTVSNMSNPVGALGAACLGVAEVFKRLIRLKTSRGGLVDGLSFSLYSYRCEEDDCGPALPTELPLDLLLVGVGAIGNGIVHLMGQLPTSGRAWIVDAQTFREENLGTCLLIGPRDLGVPKALFAATVLSSRLQVRGFHEDLETFQRRFGAELSYPRVVLTALDNIEARHTAQKLWPDLIIDGAIGDFPCQVSHHPWGDDGACLVCLFRHPPGPSAGSVASRATGLSRSRVQQPDEPVTEDDVRAAPEDRQAWLRQRLGQQTCSVVREGVAQMISQEDQHRSFSPSVPFVACMSACMVVAELVKFSAGWSTALETRYQFDMLTGPAFGSMVPQDKRQDCECLVRRNNINKWRRLRVATSDLV